MQVPLYDVRVEEEDGEFVKLKVELPGVASASDITVRIEPPHVVHVEVPQRYCLALELAVAIDAAADDVRFRKKTGKLTMYCRVVRTAAPAGEAPTAEQADVQQQCDQQPGQANSAALEQAEQQRQADKQAAAAAAAAAKRQQEEAQAAAAARQAEAQRRLEEQAAAAAAAAAKAEAEAEAEAEWRRERQRQIEEQKRRLQQQAEAVKRKREQRLAANLAAGQEWLRRATEAASRGDTEAAERALAKAAQFVFTLPQHTVEVPATGWRQLEKQLLDTQRAMQRGAAPHYSPYEKFCGFIIVLFIAVLILIASCSLWSDCATPRVTDPLSCSNVLW